MKKLLYVYITIQMTVGVLNFISLLSISVFYAIFSLFASLISLIIPIILLKYMETTEQMQTELFRLRRNLEDIRQELNGVKEEKNDSSAVSPKNTEVAIGTWKCIKCGAVNKEGTTYCENCKSAYSSEDNPTSDPSKPKKLNRWGI